MVSDVLFLNFIQYIKEYGEQVFVPPPSPPPPIERTSAQKILFTLIKSGGVSLKKFSETATVNKTGVKVMALNTFSLMPHLDELRVFISGNKPHIIGITETKIDSTIQNSDIEIDEYVIERNDRDEHGGSVVLYIHKSINYRLREDLQNTNVKSISIQVKVGKYKPFIITSIYRPSGKTVNHFNDIDAFFSIIEAEDKESIYFGDTSQITQLIKSLTATSKTIIDHIITNRLEVVAKSEVLACGISDPDAVFMTKHMRLPNLKAPPRLLNVRNYKKFNLHAFRQNMNNVPFHKIKSICKDANEMWILWGAFFLDILNKHAHVINIKIKGNNIPYVTSELKSMIRQRDYLRDKANKTGSHIFRQA